MCSCIPREHVVTLPELPVPLLTAGLRRGPALRDAPWSTALGAQGSWVAENNIVSQAVPHVHVHVVPRTKGDGLRGFFWPRQKYAERRRDGRVRRPPPALRLDGVKHVMM